MNPLHGNMSTNIADLKYPVIVRPFDVHVLIANSTDQSNALYIDRIYSQTGDSTIWSQQRWPYVHNPWQVPYAVYGS